MFGATAVPPQISPLPADRLYRAADISSLAFTTTADFSPRMRAQIDRFFASVGQGFNAYVEARSRRDQIEKLQVLSDADLARLGITRDKIVAYVFRDRIGI